MRVDTRQLDALGAMLGSEGWVEVALPVLTERLERLRRTLEKAPLSEVEKLQGEIGLLRRLVDEPHRFFRPDVHRGKGEKA